MSIVPVASEIAMIFSDELSAKTLSHNLQLLDVVDIVVDCANIVR